MEWYALGRKKLFFPSGTTCLFFQMSTHPSVNEISAEKHKAIALEPCFDLFTQREKLSATDAWCVVELDIMRLEADPSPN